MKINRGDIPLIVSAYRDEHIPMIALAARYGVTRMAIYKVLVRSGIDTSKEAAHISTTCHNCNKPIKKVRSIIRNQLHSYCDFSCYYAWLNRRDRRNPLISNRHGSRIARKVIAPYFFVSYGMIVHHEDRNENNNELHNLKVFKNQGDHVRYHRGFTVVPAWEGTNYENVKNPIRSRQYLNRKFHD